MDATGCYRIVWGRNDSTKGSQGLEKTRRRTLIFHKGALDNRASQLEQLLVLFILSILCIDVQ